jgi:hypothetical protein
LGYEVCRDDHMLSYYGWNLETLVMANVKKGTLTRPPQWWKHLRDWKRVFWKSERSASKKDVKERQNES